uniref:EF-hand domain-containing protein n=1 Tax=Heterorhabditis bacteriophora TaxID=37862 RepID=A0A1I7XCI2_HETBA
MAVLFIYENTAFFYSFFDNDGFIEKSEMIECVQDLALTLSYPHAVIEELFKEADVDGDGKISFEGVVFALSNSSELYMGTL